MSQQPSGPSGYSGPSTLRQIKNIALGPARPILVNVAWFALGVAFLQSPVSEYLTPEI